MHIRSLCAIASVATATASVGSSHAAIVYSGPLNLSVPVGTSSPLPRLWIDLDTFATSTTASFTGWDVSFSGSNATFLTANSQTLSNNVFVATGIGTPTPIARLNPGTVIGAGSSFGANGGGTVAMPTYTVAPGPFLANSEGIMGFRRVVNGQTLYGWISIQVGSDMLTRSITGIAYEDSGASIIAGAIPAPGAVAVLGIGGVFAGRCRRRAR
ncbi:MAG: hypothetical protein ACKOHI_06690 [Phycisphaerales bacterium]